MVIPVSVSAVVRLVTIIIIRDNRLLSLQVIKPSRCESREKHKSLVCWQTGERRERTNTGTDQFLLGKVKSAEVILLFSNTE